MIAVKLPHSRRLDRIADGGHNLRMVPQVSMDLRSAPAATSSSTNAAWPLIAEARGPPIPGDRKSLAINLAILAPPAVSLGGWHSRIFPDAEGDCVGCLQLP